MNNVVNDNGPEGKAAELTKILQDAGIIAPNHKVGVSRGCTKKDFIKRVERFAMIRGAEKEKAEAIFYALEHSDEFDILFKED